MKMHFESKSETTNGVTESEYRLNGQVIPRWKALPYMAFMFVMMALAAVIFGPVIMAMFGIAALMIWVALAIVALTIIPAGLYRLTIGRWPNWFKVEYSETTERT